MISIVIPLYDKVTQVSRTLDSVRRQGFLAYELLIIDDGSTDGSPEAVRAYLNKYRNFARQVRLLSQQHAGVSAARNRGIQESRFDWIAFLDADDMWTPDYLATQYELSLKYPSCEVLAAAYGFSRGAGQFTPARFSRLPFRGPDGVLTNYFEVAACSHPPLSSIMTIVRKRAIQTIGGFPEGIASGEDLLTWAKLALYYPIAFNRKCMGVYDHDASRANKDQQQRMPARADTVGEYLEDLLHQHPDIPGLKQYVGTWHKMRTRIYLTNSMRKEAWSEWKKLARFHPAHYKTWAYLLLLISPVRAFQ